MDSISLHTATSDAGPTLGLQLLTAPQVHAPTSITVHTDTRSLRLHPEDRVFEDCDRMWP